MRSAYDHEFYNSSTKSYAATSVEVQSLTATTLATGAASDEHRTEALVAMVTDVKQRDYHLTVGAVGQKFLLTELSGNGEHDAALKVATQTTFPSWGHWIANGATTCWENWSGRADPTHPPAPTHNHIFLCGGVGEWLYTTVAGISPGGRGYSTVRIAPQISKTEGTPTAAHAIARRCDSVCVCVGARLVHTKV